MTRTRLSDRPWCKPSSKSGSNWTEDDLTAFKITLERQDSATFFGVDPLPHPVKIPAAILTDLSPNKDTQDRETYRFLRLMKLARMNGPTESAIFDFSLAVLQLMHYDDPGFVARSHVDIPLVMCGEWRNAQTDLCVVDKHEFLLIVQEANRIVGPAGLEARLVAAAIAAFHQNNRRRDENHLPILKSRIMAGITICGTFPKFYKIPITQDLVECVQMGIEPMTETKILRLVVLFPDDFSEGMIPLGNRLQALEFYDAFKALVCGDQTVQIWAVRFHGSILNFSFHRHILCLSC
jgi:hypothetical protein